MQCTGKDNLALVSAWKLDAAVSVVTWGGSTSWTGCKSVELAQAVLENGKIAYKTEASSNVTNADPAMWESTSESSKATPGEKNN